ncbi:hypothetical protein I6M34_06135 [Shewanella algae]|uniref:hypothetical protein n=1 Tax=Shewanella algae TaxID=38313 RepID=UPI001AAD7AC3|nr:hypothetical protein [Shewanella algae]MBO2602690.1 hypothetical protein [Shewanella algae]
MKESPSDYWGTLIVKRGFESFKRWHWRELIDRITTRGQELPVNRYGSPASYEQIVAAYDGHVVMAKKAEGDCFEFHFLFFPQK